MREHRGARRRRPTVPAALALACAIVPLGGLAAGPAPDPARGEALYVQCAACHSLGRDRTGPRHCGLLGRPAGSIPGFPYSAAMRESGFVWTAATLDRFLKAPTRVVPGTTMGYAGIADATDRRDLVAYLALAGGPDGSCGTLPPASRPAAPPPAE